MFDVEKYVDFVDSVTSESGKNDEVCFEHLQKLSTQTNGSFSRLDMGITGLAGEVGEVVDVWKKIKYHNKDFDDEMKSRLIAELGDVYWYLATISKALNVSMYDLMQKNQEKLEARHQNGFSNAYITRAFHD